MRQLNKYCVTLLLAVLLLAGCSMRTVEDMYTPPKRSAEYEDLQRAIDEAMEGLEYAPALNGENRQSVQMADLDGDGTDEYLLFSRDTSESPLKILIFTRDESGCKLQHTIPCAGSAFDTIDYVNLDGTGGMELVVGRQISNLILRTASVYTFDSVEAKRLMSVNYSRILATDLNLDGKQDLLVIASGESDADNAIATLFSYEDGTMRRSVEAELSATSDRIKRIMVSQLNNHVPAVFVASNVNDHAIITDVFAVKDGKFSNVSFSNESGTSVRTLRNYYVYADDIDDDGILELPDLIDMVPVKNTWRGSNQQMIRWYAMDIMGKEEDRMYTFHNFDSGWYLQLNGQIAPRISVVQQDGGSVFYLWDEAFQNTEILMTIDVMTGAGNAALEENGYYELYRAEDVIYTVKLEAAAAKLGLTAQLLSDQFHLIQWDWKNGET